jgi:hypothetical protein
MTGYLTEDLGIGDISAMFAPELLTREYKWIRSLLVYYFPEYPYIDENWYIVIGDETKVYHDSEINRHQNGSRISGTHSGSYEEHCLLGYNDM